MERLKTGIHIDGSFCILLAILLLLLPLKWVVAVVTAALVHELFHAAAVCILSGKINSIRFSLSGARMDMEPLSPGRELLAALAGPLGSALLIFLAPILPRTAVCGLVHCVYNLLPIFPLDGGRILRNAVTLLLPGQRGECLYEFSQWLFRLLLLGICCFLGLGWGLLPTVAIIFLLKWQRKKQNCLTIDCFEGTIYPTSQKEVRP